VNSTTECCTDKNKMFILTPMSTSTLQLLYTSSITKK